MQTAIRTEFIEANGLRFEVNICGEGDKFALCLHGFPESAFSWRYQMPLLAKLGYRVWAPNMRGYGRSSRPPGKRAYHIDHLTDDIAGLIKASKASSTLLIGHDWGGVIAWMYALRDSKSLDKLIAMNIPHPLRLSQHCMRWPQILRSYYIPLFKIPFLPERLFGMKDAKLIGDAFRESAIDKSRFPEEVLAVYRKQACQSGALTAMLNYYRANFTLRGGLLEDKRQIMEQIIEVPTLMIWGEEDVALGKTLTYGTDELVSNLSIHYLPGVSHWVQQEAPEKVNAIMEAWLLGG